MCTGTCSRTSHLRLPTDKSKLWCFNTLACEVSSYSCFQQRTSAHFVYSLAMVLDCRTTHVYAIVLPLSATTYRSYPEPTSSSRSFVFVNPPEARTSDSRRGLELGVFPSYPERAGYTRRSIVNFKEKTRWQDTVVSRSLPVSSIVNLKFWNAASFLPSPVPSVFGGRPIQVQTYAQIIMTNGTSCQGMSML